MSSMQAIARCPMFSAPAVDQAQWYAAYTFPRHEKKIHEQLAQQSVECYLPLYEEVHTWKDRRVKLQTPLFPGYVFIHIAMSERMRVLNLERVIRLVGGMEGKPASLPAEEIEALKRSLQHRKVQPFPYLAKGRRVRLKSGPLEGLQGIVLRHKGQFRLVVSVECIMNSAMVDLEASDVEPLL